MEQEKKNQCLQQILKIPTLLLIGIIKLYQWTLSPLLGSNCRFIPTCSAYGIEAFKKYGLFKGFWLSIKRISKCHPLGKSGYDPLP